MQARGGARKIFSFTQRCLLSSAGHTHIARSRRAGAIFFLELKDMRSGSSRFGHRRADSLGHPHYSQSRQHDDGQQHAAASRCRGTALSRATTRSVAWWARVRRVPRCHRRSTVAASRCVDTGCVTKAVFRYVFSENNPASRDAATRHERKGPTSRCRVAVPDASAKVRAYSASRVVV